jgi:uncharacterized coiled-coil protein SlyX
MPVTAKLSRKFYETFGDDIANELVEWFNQVDLTYRTELRELNELNFQRFDAKLEQRLVEQDSRWNARFVALEASLDKRFAEYGNRLSALEGRMAKLEERFESRVDGLEVRVAALEAAVASLNAKVDLRISELRTEIADQKAGLHRWMFVYWAGTVVPLAGLILALHALG